jgi:hypothetical protein
MIRVVKSEEINENNQKILGLLPSQPGQMSKIKTYAFVSNTQSFSVVLSVHVLIRVNHLPVSATSWF